MTFGNFLWLVFAGCKDTCTRAARLERESTKSGRDTMKQHEVSLGVVLLGFADDSLNGAQRSVVVDSQQTNVINLVEAIIALRLE